MISMTLLRGGDGGVGVPDHRGRGGIVNKHSTDVEYPPHPSHVCMSIQAAAGRGKKIMLPSRFEWVGSQ
jgi:hypothetical protein